MSTTHIYRVETASGSGPYAGPEQVSCLDNELCDRIYEMHPNPRNDGLNFIRGTDCCAFETLEQLYAWFSPAIAAYLPERFEISEYLVEESLIKRGGHQIAVPISALTEPVRRMPLTRYQTVTI